MGDNLFAGSAAVASVQEKTAAKPGKTAPIDYAEPPSGILFCITSFLIGFAMGFAVLFIYFRIIPLCIAGGAVTGGVYIFVAQNNAVVKRKTKLRAQFYDLLEAVSVSMRAGNPAFKALESAKTDLLLIYAPDSDILVELNIILLKFNNAVPLSEAFSDLAERSGLEDIASFASIYETIEGKSSRADEIVRETQQIIADKMEMEMEIETMMTAAKSEVTIMLFMPLVILLVISYAGAGFMDSLYITPVGRVVAAFGLVIFIISFIFAKKLSKIEL